MQPRTQDRLARMLGYALGGVTALVLLAWAIYKLWVVVDWLR